MHEITAFAYSQAVAAELRAERGRKQMTVSQLATMTGISKSAVLNYLNGHRDIPLAALARLCLALGVSVATIASRAETP